MAWAFVSILHHGIGGSLLSAATINATVGGAATGAYYLNFDDLALGFTNGTATTTSPNGSATVMITSDGQVVSGSGANYAAPYLSNSNGAPFGDSTVAGVDSTHYLTTGSSTANGSVEISFTTAMQYFGLLWGSVDLYNTLEFYDGMTRVDTVTGGDVKFNADGDQGVNGTYYVNIVPNGSFDRVVATSSGYAFEIDNVSYSPLPLVGGAQPVPDGGMTLAMLGASLGGLAWFRRKSK